MISEDFIDQEFAKLTSGEGEEEEESEGLDPDQFFGLYKSLLKETITIGERYIAKKQAELDRLDDETRSKRLITIS